MTRWIWMASIWLITACGELAVQTPVTTPIVNSTHHATVLPQPLTACLKTNFPGWQVVSITDYSKTWWSFYDSSYNPCWVSTDINDDQLTDYALWLKKHNQLRLVICTGKADQLFDQYTITDIPVDFDESQHNLTIGLAVAPPAQIDVVSPRIQSLTLKSNGIALMELEERVRIYFWQQGVIQTFYMK